MSNWVERNHIVLLIRERNVAIYKLNYDLQIYIIFVG